MTALATHQAYLGDVLARQKTRRALVDAEYDYPKQPEITLPPGYRVEGDAEAGPSKHNVINYVPAEETIRNDYCAWYGVSGHHGGEFILGAEDHEICEEYPALRRLMVLKAELTRAHSHQPLHLPLSLHDPSSLLHFQPNRFDVILIHPLPTWSQTSQLPIRQLSSDPGFIFLWVGSGDSDGLEKGRECLAKWGFRRAEDIVWVKKGLNGTSGQGLFRGVKEHCLMGIKGTVRRSTDTRFVHCNVDTDVMVWDQPEDPSEPSPPHPPYLHTLIENFCLGTRRLEINPQSPQSRSGWMTTSPHPVPPTSQLFDPTTYPSFMPSKSEGRDILPYHPEIDNLRPKSPQRRPRDTFPGQRGGSGFRPPRQQGFGGNQMMGQQNMQPGYGMGMGMDPAMMMAMSMASMGMGMPNPGYGFDPQLAFMMAQQQQMQMQNQYQGNYGGMGVNAGQPGNDGYMGGMGWGQGYAGDPRYPGNQGGQGWQGGQGHGQGGNQQWQGQGQGQWYP